MTVDRSAPSREKDAAVARAMGKRDICQTRFDSERSLRDWECRDLPSRAYPAGKLIRLPTYTTSEPYDSTHWGEMLEWLSDQCSSVDVGVGDYHMPWVRWSPKSGDQISVTAYGQTIGDALANAVLAVRAWLSERDGEQ